MLDDTGSASLVKIDYFDGLGRPVQSVLKTASPTQKDIVSLQEYDGIGRESNVWLPTPTGGTGAYVTPATLKTTSNSFYGDAYAYRKPVYEQSPLNRVTEQYAPGAAWHTGGKSVKTDWLTNTSLGVLTCALYVVMSDNSLQRKGLYEANELFVTKSTDEELNISYTFTDKLGQIVLDRVMDGTIINDTYYDFDDYGNLRYVLPPTAADVLNTVSSWSDENQTLKDYAYIYKYDNRNRCIQKRLPGCEPVEMRYDKADRLIFSQDGKQRVNSEWNFCFYDVFGRQTVTGIWKSATLPSLDNLVVKSDYSGSGPLAGHSINLTLPGVELMTVNFYDDYAFTSGVSQLTYVTPPTGYDTQFSSAKGLLTGTRIYQLNNQAKYSVAAFYYDHREQVVQTHTSNHMGGFEDEYLAYNFIGKVKQMQHVHSATGKTTQTEVYTYSYDHAERLLSVTHKYNTAAAITLAQYTYDEVGRVKTKKLASETSSYNYNVRSWLTQISGAKFNQTLAYNAAVNGITPTKALYNGNISAMKWNEVESGR